MWLEIGRFLIGLVALIVGAEILVRGASRLATSFGVSPLVVGLTIVAFGTSSPEIAVSVGAALSGNTELAVGNVVGSNIFNVLFILGASALIVPLTVHSQLVRQEVPIMIGASAILLVMVLDGGLARYEALLLVGLAVFYTAYLVIQSRKESAEVAAEYAAGAPKVSRWESHPVLQIGMIVGGLVLLVAGANWLVDASVAFAQALGVSDVVIGLTIVAAGTSMPEVATSLLAALRGERDIAVGNVVGSNTFNILACLGLAGVVAPGGLPVPPSVLNFDLWVMVAVALTCIPVFASGRKIARWEGGVLFAYYIAYAAYLVLDASGHDSLDEYSAVMLSFAIPLTIVAIVAAYVRPRQGRS
ncbi:MAG TPA: calcium/sodium antiporter [Steroidobacteraceae bacterium]|nr:calcium/sodium antiporter [Steroidobacteraceae bacterium]